ncbi:MAG: hypothetical protein JWQ71_2866 [Pedosphaera sp.]|nr:hypothetical protein [Pedosphaera sp.]
MCGDHAEEFIAAVGAGEIQNVRTGFKAGAGDGGLIGFDGDEDVGSAEFLDDGEQAAVLIGFINTRGVGEAGFGTDINDLRTLGVEDFAALDGAFGGEANTFAIPGIGGEIDDSHDGGLRIESEGLVADGKFLDADLGGGMVFIEEFSEYFESEHF